MTSTKSTPKKNLIVSDHIGHHKKIANKDQLGHYLAGLIEGNGCFNSTKLEITFHIKDVSAAYQLRSYLSYGNVVTNLSKRVLLFTINNPTGLKHVFELINGKLVGDRIVTVLKNNNYAQLGVTILPPSKCMSLTNHWLAGFLDVNANLKLFIYNKGQKKGKEHACIKNVGLSLQFYTVGCTFNLIANVLAFEKTKICNNIEPGPFLAKHGKNPCFAFQKAYFLNITDPHKIKRLTDYLDKFNLQTLKYTQYFIFRRCYRHMQKKGEISETQLKRFRNRLQNVYN